jgi:hypothetical protein
MGSWTDMISDFAEGFVDSYRSVGRIERLCRELGWSVDEREGNKIRLHFNIAGGGIRKISIVNGDECLITFLAHSSAVFAADDISPKLLAYMLCRNLEGGEIGAWGINIDRNTRSLCSFHVIYRALGDGLNAAALQYICKSLCEETGDFEDKLRQAGLLR